MRFGPNMKKWQIAMVIRQNKLITSRGWRRQNRKGKSTLYIHGSGETAWSLEEAYRREKQRPMTRRSTRTVQDR